MTDRVILYHYPLDPFCRRVRLTLLEKGIPVGLIQEKTWERRPAFLEKNPLGTVPLLVEPDGHSLSGANAICEYLNELNSKYVEVSSILENCTDDVDIGDIARPGKLIARGG